jgi:hypothetical protein
MLNKGIGEESRKSELLLEVGNQIVNPFGNLVFIEAFLRRAIPQK